MPAVTNTHALSVRANIRMFVTERTGTPPMPCNAGQITEVIA